MRTEAEVRQELLRLRGVTYLVEELISKEDARLDMVKMLRWVLGEDL